jgi:rhodanese-related sulfurtransferase
MKKKRLKQLAVVLFGVIVILCALVVWALFTTTRDLDAQAAATPQVPVGADERTLAAAVGELPPEVNVSTVDALGERDDVYVVDVRSASEYASGHVPGSHNIPEKELVSRVAEMPKDGEVILTCRTGHKSGKAVGLLEAAGVTNVHHMTGGMRAWRHAGHEVEQ